MSVIRPTVLGYLAVSSPDELARGQATLAAHAALEGFGLAEVYADVVGVDAAFYRLLDHARTGEVTAILVPDLSHLQHLACLAEADLLAVSRYVRLPVLTV